MDGDGKPELVVCLFNARKDGRWWLEILDPKTGTLKMEMPDMYLWGVQDVDGDGVSELLIGKVFGRNPVPFSTVEVISVKNLKPATLWSCDNARFAGRALRPSGWKSNFRPMQFGHDETWTELSEGGGTIFLFTVAPDRTRSFAEVSWRDGRISIRSTPLGLTGEFVMTALADVDGDGVSECVLSENNGRILIVRADKGIQASWAVGFRLQLEGFSAARPGPVPVVYRAPQEQQPFVTIPDNTNTLHQLQVDRSGMTVVEKWQKRGRGWMGYDNCFHSAYVRDVDGDGTLEVMAVNPERGDYSELMALSPDGTVKRSWSFLRLLLPGRHELASMNGSS